MINLVKIIFLLASFCAFSQVTPFYTTRLLSTGGAGVGSILVNEASVLNPASIVFIPITNFYFQQSRSSLDNNSSSRSNRSSNGQTEIYQIADSSSTLKGTFSYQNQSRNGYSRRKYVSSFAASIGKNTSMGIIYSYNNQNTPLKEEESFHQGSLGLTYVHNKKLSLGFVLKDPFLSNREESSFKSGLQFAVFQNMVFIQDFEYPLKPEGSDGLTIRSALQINFFQDFYLRAGKFEDKMLKTSGYSYGLFWVGPKLSIGYALMKSTFTEDTQVNFEDETDIESALSFSLRF